MNFRFKISNCRRATLAELVRLCLRAAHLPIANYRLGFIAAFCVFLCCSNALTQVDLGVSPENERQEAQEERINEKKEGFFSFMNSLFSKKDSSGEKIPEDTLGKLIKQAEEGDLDAQLSLGYLYLYGDKGIESDDVKSVRYYSMAAAQNDMVAINNLGSLYYSGIGVDKDVGKAVELFKKASSLGNTESSLNLAFILLTGSGIRKDPAQAVNLFSKAAAVGNPTAQFMLGYAYYKGFVVQKNDKKAFDLVKAAADAGYADAQYILALMYLDGFGTTKNYGNAVRQFEKAAQQGNVEAMMTLAEIMALGKVYTQNIFLAHVWFNIASLYGAKEASKFRDAVEEKMKIEQILEAQSQAEKFKERPTDLTNYIRNTFGYNIRGYMG